MKQISAEEYLGSLAGVEKREFERLQTIVLARCPEAALAMSYGMPTFKYQGKVIVHFGVFKDHLSIFPGAGPVDQLADRLTDFKTSKGTIQFTDDAPLSDELLEDIISLCVKRAQS